MRKFMTQPWPQVLFGEGTSKELGAQCTRLGAKRVMAVYGKNLYATGAVEPILQLIAAEKDIVLERFDGIEPESPDYVVEALGKAAAAFDADTFVVIGGGSAIDTARAASMYRYCADIPFEECQRRGFIPLPEEQVNGIKLIFVPTTAGTGAEMSSGGPLLNTKTNVKGGPFFGVKLAALAVLDPTLTYGLSPYLTYTTAMDALSHAIEGMTGKTRSPRSDMFCGQAVEYIWRSLPRALENGEDAEARGELLLAANLAIGVETLRHLGHAICQPVGGLLHLGHGHSCALALPPALRMIANSPEVREELKLIAAKMGLDPASETVGEDIADAITESNRKFGIQSLKDMGFDFEQVRAAVPLIMADGRLLPNAVVAVSEADVETMLREMYEY
ncbi:MAG: iron-containing alcohol dehydrogenase [Clostridiales bacterium]|nr:iron-containing alcohol dehydrogenase [Clostridiales bacterium]